MTLLKIEQLSLSFSTYMGRVQALRNLSLEIQEGEILGIVGESGCGKSVTANLMMGLISMPPAIVENGTMTFQEQNLLKFTSKQWRQFRGREIGMIFQDPMTSLNPLMSIGDQIKEVFYVQERLTKKEATYKTLELLELVEITHPEKRLNQYPHELSGGMRQRICIAMALACRPKLLIADEPTTALDVTIQAQILDLLESLHQKLGMTILLISHDFGVIGSLCDRVLVMYGGEMMEEGKTAQLFEHPAHPYTEALLRSMPHLELDRNTPLTVIEGTPIALTHPPEGCPFVTRCPHAMHICLKRKPKAYHIQENQISRCWKEELKHV